MQTLPFSSGNLRSPDQNKHLVGALCLNILHVNINNKSLHELVFMCLHVCGLTGEIQFQPCCDGQSYHHLPEGGAEDPF